MRMLHWMSPYIRQDRIRNEFKERVRVAPDTRKIKKGRISP